MERGRSRELSSNELRTLASAFRSPRGRYSVHRASQLAGVPERTLYEWARSDVVIPDYPHARPKQWSYRDLVFLRMTAWLRSQGMNRSMVVDQVAAARAELAQMAELSTLPVIRSDGRSVLRGNETVDPVTGQALLSESFLSFLNVFELVVPIEVHEIGKKQLWGPNLITPADRVYIDPWVMGGEPCVEDSRIPTSTLFALRTDRALTPTAIASLYPGIEAADVESAVTLETALRRRSKLAA